MSLITFEEAKEHLNVDHNEDDNKIEILVYQASSIVLDYIGVDEDEWQDTAGMPAGVPKNVEAATFLVLGALYENRDGSDNAPQPLSQAVKDLLHRKRIPPIA